MNGETVTDCINNYHPMSLNNYLKTYYTFDEVTAIITAVSYSLKYGLAANVVSLGIMAYV